jgi:Uma2 family endonuclease
MVTSARPGATVADLYRVPENRKAEIVGGELQLMSPTGALPGRAAAQIYLSLRQFESRAGGGYAIPDNVGILVDLPHRRSFSPDAAFHRGPLSGRFLEGAPVFAAEVRSESDYGPQAEEAMAAKRSDYFAAGTLIVWDVDVLQDVVIRVYRASERQRATEYRRGQHAEAEPALPGWRMIVDDLLT